MQILWQDLRHQCSISNKISLYLKTQNKINQKNLLLRRLTCLGTNNSSFLPNKTALILFG